MCFISKGATKRGKRPTFAQTGCKKTPAAQRQKPTPQEMKPSKGG